MKKVMKFVKGKRDEDAQTKFTLCDSKRLSNEKIEVNSKDDEFICRDKSVTKLHKAVWNENCDKLKSIIKTHDIDITDKFDRTALYFAVLKNNSNIVAILLDNKANQSIPDIDGITPFLKSVQLGHLQCAQILLDYGADIKRVDKDLNSCVHFAVMEKHINMLSFLLKRNADINVVNSNGDQPLHIATKMKNIQIIELLLNCNCEMNVMNLEGLSPFMLAKQKGDLELISIFQKHIGKISEQSNVASSSNILQLNSEIKKPHTDSDGWNDSPVCSPSKRQTEKSLAKIAEHFFSEEVSVSEEKSESDMSIKCSENTSPQSGIIPPPCKPLRSLEYLQSGLALENRPVHLLTLGTVRTRHISMTESEHSKNNTPHRYSYQGDFQVMGGGDSLNKLPDEKGDSINVSVKSKLLSKLECDSTIQSDWGSNESLPLDESSCGGKKDVKTLVNNTHKNNSSCGSLRDKSIDTFLQKQFSILEDYEKNHERTCSVSHEIYSNANNSDSNLDDIDHLLEDNNRINAQLERYAGQSDILFITKKSKSLPRNCESYNSYHKGSFSLPRTLEAGKDPFREIRSYGYFKPKSHFFSLKIHKNDRRSGFMDKLKNMFNKKSQIHLSESAETSGTWLYKDKFKNKNHNELHVDNNKSIFKSEHSSSISENDHLENAETMCNNSLIVGNDFNMKDLETDNSSISVSFLKYNSNKSIEKKILSLSNMHIESTQSRKSLSSHSGISNINEIANLESDFNSNKTNGNVIPDNLIVCEDCAEYLSLKLLEAKKIISSKDKSINLLQSQLNQLQERNIQNISKSHENYYRYGLAMHELIEIKHVSEQVEEDLYRMQSERGRKPTEAEKARLKEQDTIWKKQYAEYKEREQRRNENMPPFDEINWRTVLQNEVSSAVNTLKENSQTVINALENQNVKLETLVEKLQNDLQLSSLRQQELEDNLILVKNQLIEAQSFKNNCEKSYEDTTKRLQDNKENLENELKNIRQQYACLQKEFENKTKQNDADVKYFNQINSEYEILKEKNLSLSSQLSKFSAKMDNMKERAKFHNRLLKNEFKKIKCKSSQPNSEKITASEDSIEIIAIDADSNNITFNTEQLFDMCRTDDDFEKLEKENIDLEKTLLVLEKNNNDYLEDENRKLKHEVDAQLKLIEVLENDIRILKEQAHDKVQDQKEIGLLKSQNDTLTQKISQLQSDLEAKDVLNNEQLMNVTLLKNQNQENEYLFKDIQTECDHLKHSIEKEKNINFILETENKRIKDSLDIITQQNANFISENKKLKSDLDNINKEKKSIETELRIAVNAIEELQSTIAGTSEKIENLELLNKDLKEQVASLLSKYEILQADIIAKDKTVQQYRRKSDTLSSDILSLKDQIQQEKLKCESMTTQIDSLKFFHENEMNASSARYKELKNESECTKLELQSAIEKVKNENSVLLKKLTELDKERANLFKKINNLNKEIRELNKLKNVSESNTDIMKSNDSSKGNTKLNSVTSSKKVLDENNGTVADETKITLESVTGVLKNAVIMDKSDVMNDTIEIQSSTQVLHSKHDKPKRTSKIPLPISKNDLHKLKVYTDNSTETDFRSNDENYFSANSLKTDKEKSCTKCENETEVLLERVNNIEKQLSSLLIHKIKSKSLSMTNLDTLSGDKIKSANDVLKQGTTSTHKTYDHFIRKSSSLHSVSTENIKQNNIDYHEPLLDKSLQISKERWDKHLDTIQNLESQLTEVINILDLGEKKQISTPALVNTEQYKQLIDALQKQVWDLQMKSDQESSKCYQLQTELQGLKGQMVAKKEMEHEIASLRKELYKQKSERIQEIELTKMKKEAEIVAVQQELKHEYLKSKQKLLSDLTKVQNALQAKNEAEAMLQKKCEELVKEVAANQEERKKQILNVPHKAPITRSQPIALRANIRPITQIVPVVKAHTEKLCSCATSLPSTSKVCHCVVHLTTNNIPDKPCICDVPQPVLLNAVRNELNTVVQRHRPKTDAVASNSVPDEELNEKYLLQ